jgi:hypothetical protein
MNRILEFYKDLARQKFRKELVLTEHLNAMIEQDKLAAYGQDTIHIKEYINELEILLLL